MSLLCILTRFTVFICLFGCSAYFCFFNLFAYSYNFNYYPSSPLQTLLLILSHIYLSVRRTARLSALLSLVPYCVHECVCACGWVWVQILSLTCQIIIIFIHSLFKQRKPQVLKIFPNSAWVSNPQTSIWKIVGITQRSLNNFAVWEEREGSRLQMCLHLAHKLNQRAGG